MSPTDLAAAIHSVATTDDARALSALVVRLRREHPEDPEADTVARQAEIKRRRLIQES